MPEPGSQDWRSKIPKRLVPIIAWTAGVGGCLLLAIQYLSAVGFSLLLLVSIIMALTGTEGAGTTFLTAILLLFVGLVTTVIVRSLGLGLDQ